MKSSLPLILPVGTQIVLGVELAATSAQPAQMRGAVGIILKAPVDAEHAYRIRFVNGGEASLHRGEFSVRKEFQQAGLQEAATATDDANLEQFVIFRCIIGSRAYGLDHDASDVDRRGIYLPPANLHWSIFGLPEQLEIHRRDAGATPTGATESQEWYWELGKFLILALKANPNVLECLYSPVVEFATPLARELLDMREAFLSRLVYQTYNGYVMSQFRKLEQDLRARGAIKWKHAMHLIRLLLSGETVLREGFVSVQVSAHRDQLRAIRAGKIPWDEVNTWRLDLHRQLDEAFANTRLPEQPDYARANGFLLKARRSMI